MAFDAIALALFKIGVFTAIGGFIDFMMSRTEKKRLRDWLEIWWYRFEFVNWRTLGPKEAATAVSWLDRVAGPALFSKRRWLVAILIVVGAQLLAGQLWWPKSLATGQAEGYTYTPINPFSKTLVNVLFVGLSISLTRWLSVLAVRSAGRVGALSFWVLLLTHLALALVWRPTVHEIGGFLEAGEVAYRMGIPVLEIPRGLWEANRDGTLNSWRAWNSLTIRSTEMLCDMATYGVRIVFSAAFLVSFLFTTVIRGTISRVWARVVESDKPIFALLLGGLSTAVILSTEVAKLINDGFRL